MAEITRRIGLSLGADICWPACFEALMKRLDLRIPVGGDTVRFEVERVTIEPFNLRAPCKYDLVIDRLTHWLHTSREWIKKSILMNDLYVDESARGKGAGRLIIEGGVELAREWGASHLTWATAPDNHKAQGLYDTFGAEKSTWLEYELEV